MSDNSEDQTKGVKEQLTKMTNNLPSLNAVIKASVEQTNNILSQLEITKQDIDFRINSFASSRLQPLMYQMKNVVNKAIVLYSQREYYGPQIVAGSAIAVGGLVTLRRGRLPGFFTAGVTGTGTYTAIYGAPKFNS